MSQNYLPYLQPPSPDPSNRQQTPAELLAPARRAGVLMMVLGGLCFLMSLIMLLSAMVLTPEMMTASPQAEQIQKALDQSGFSLKGLCYLFVVVMAIPGIAYLLLGFFVRGGGMVSVVLSMVLNGIGVLFLFIYVVQALLAGGLFAALCMGVLPMALTAMTIMSLIQAIKNSSHISAVQQQFRAQQAQFQQQRQAFTQPAPGAGYGYGYGSMPSGLSTSGSSPVAEQSDETKPAVRHPPLPPTPDSENPPPQL